MENWKRTEENRFRNQKITWADDFVSVSSIQGKYHVDVLDNRMGHEWRDVSSHLAEALFQALEENQKLTKALEGVEQLLGEGPQNDLNDGLDTD